jgi:hypothetical protein
MPVYTVLEPPQRTGRQGAGMERHVFVRDGFHAWAFLLTPVWMLWRRLWLVFVIYVVVLAALETGLWALGMPTTVKVVAGLLVSLLVGLEAATLRRWTLERRGWISVGVVVDDELDTAERRFFDARSERAERPSRHPTADVTNYRAPAEAHPPVFGLFPEPGVQR